MALSSHPKVWQFLFVIFLLITAAFALCFYFSKIFITFVVGFALILMAEKFTMDYRKSAKRYGLNQWKRVCYGCLLILFWLFVVVFLLRNSLGQIVDVVRQISVDEGTLEHLYGSRIYPHLPVILRHEAFTGEVISASSRYVSWLSKMLLTHTFSFMLNALLIIPLMFYLYFWRRHTIAERVFDAVPKRFKKSVLRATKDGGSQLHDFFTARVIESTVVGAICCLGFFIAGVKGWLILGLLAGFLNTVPYFGPIMGAIPPLIITLLVDPSIVALYVVLTVLIAQTIDVFYLQPFMISAKVKIEPILSILLILAGTKLLGIMGTIFAIPVYLVYKVVLREAYEELERLYG